MMGNRYQLFGDMLNQILLCHEGRFAIAGQPNAVGDAKHVGVDRHRRLVEYDRCDYIGRFTPNAGQLLQVVYVGRHFASEEGCQSLCHADQVFRLVVWVRDASYIGVYHLRRACRQDLGRWKRFEKGRSDLIDTFVCALRREDNSDQ